MSNRVATDDTLKEIRDVLIDISSSIKTGAGGVNYGFYINGNESDPDTMVTYIGDAVGMTPAYMDFTAESFNWGSWGNAFFIPKPCMVKYDGTVDYYLDVDDYTKKVDGTASDVANTSYGGNAMMEWPKIWMCIKPAVGGKSAEIWISDHKVNADYHCWSNIDCHGNEKDHFYTPIYNGSLIDGKLRSISGQMPAHNTAASQEIEYAKANNTGDDVRWYIETWADRVLINALLILISKSTDSQSKFGAGNLQHDSSDVAYYGIVSAGTANAKGLFYGDAGGEVIVKVFGMENWWANIWRRTAGLILDNGVYKTKLTWGTEDGSTVEGYNTTGNGYISLNNEPPTGTSGTYHIEELFTPLTAFIPVKNGGSQSTYYCDGFWFNNSIVGFAFCGGHVDDGRLCGALYVNVNAAPGASHWYIGASLSLK